MAAADRPVVAGIDGSPAAVHAAGWAAREAARRGRPLLLVHAMEIAPGFPADQIDLQVVHAAMLDQGRRWLREAATAAAVPGVTGRTDLEFAPPVPMLVTFSRHAEQLVVAARGLGGFEGLVLGGTATALCGRALCPLVVVPATADVAARGPVVVGVDTTEASAETAEAVVGFAFEEASLRRTDLVAVHAWTEVVIDNAWDGGTILPHPADLAREAADSLTERLARWRDKYPDVAVRTEVAHDRPSRALERAGRSAQLLVVGTHTRPGRFPLGSTSRELVQDPPCPVAVVPPTRVLPAASPPGSAQHRAGSPEPGQT